MRIAFGALLAVAVLYAVAFWMRRSSMFFPDRYPVGEWNTGDLRVKPADVTFASGDGTRLHGWLLGIPAPDAPILVWFHGNAGNITSRAAMASELASRGITVFLFDWRGYGRSEGSPAEGALYLDALAAYDHAAQLPNGGVVAYGESLGGPYAAYVAKHRRVRGVVIENSFPSLRELANALYHPFPLGWTAPRAMRTTEWLNDAGVPVLVMHGRRDTVIPFALGQRLYDGLRGPREMLVSETADHSQISAAEGARYYDTVARFIANTPQ